jgi:NAD(P)-dependent dehydrogenase (short-subunit alcohol dehydrogenase family)
MKRVQNKVAVVTGGAFGIGPATCELLAREGARVVIADIKDEEGRRLAGELENKGYAVVFKHLDATNEEETREVMRTIYQEYGSIDILVNNTEVPGAGRSAHDLTLEDWRKMLDDEAGAVFLAIKHAARYMEKNGGGSIINLSSIRGITGSSSVQLYDASEGAVRLMTKTNALRYAEKRIRVNAVHPRRILAPRAGKNAREARYELGEDKGNPDIGRPIGRMSDPDDVARGILYLASDESKFVTGSELVIDGGFAGG